MSEGDRHPWADRAGGLGHAVLPGRLAGAAHDQQRALAQRERLRAGARRLGTTGVGPQLQHARLADAQDRDAGVGALDQAIAVPCHRIPAVAVEVEADRAEAPPVAPGQRGPAAGRAPPAARARRWPTTTTSVGARAACARTSAPCAAATSACGPARRTPRRPRAATPTAGRPMLRPPAPPAAARRRTDRPTAPHGRTANLAPARSRAPAPRIWTHVRSYSCSFRAATARSEWVVAIVPIDDPDDERLSDYRHLRDPATRRRRSRADSS